VRDEDGAGEPAPGGPARQSGSRRPRLPSAPRRYLAIGETSGHDELIWLGETKYSGAQTPPIRTPVPPRIAKRYGKERAPMPFDLPRDSLSDRPRAIFVNAPVDDHNFEVTGVIDCVRAARHIYTRIYRRPDALVAVYPHAGHDFPPGIREEAWRFLERML
jgi:hypothetical protein